MAEGIIRVHMIRVLPDSISAVARQIEIAIAAKPEVKATVYLCLGDYDLVLLSFAPHDKGRILGDRWHSGIVGVREIPVFLWRPEDRSEQVYESLVQNDRLCLVFSYLNPLAAINHGLQFECEVSLEVSRKVTALGLYGIPELLFIAPWAIPGELQDVCGEIYSAFHRVTTKNEIEYPLLQRTLTFAIFKGGATEALRSLPEYTGAGSLSHLAKSFRDSTTGAPYSLRVGVSSSFRNHQRIEILTRGIFEGRRINFYSSPGQQDFVFDLKTDGSAEDLIIALTLIHVFRSTAAPYILGTATSLIFPDGRETLDGELFFESAAAKSPVLRTAVYELEPDECKQIEATLGETGRRVIRTVFNFNDIGSNPILAACVIDMSRAVAALADRALYHARKLLAEAATGGKSKDHRIGARVREEELNEMMMPIHSAVDQRTIAAHAAVSPVESGTRHLLGGIGRLLLAIESIPHSLFRSVPGDRYYFWWGYALSGVRHPYFYHEMQVIDIPPEELWKPEDWFVVIHESMHAIVKYETLSGGENFRALAGWLEKPSDLEQEFVIESAIDILTFNAGPAWDPALYFRSIWDYLGRCFRFSTSGEWDLKRLYMLVLRNWNVWLVNHLMAKKTDVEILLGSDRFEDSLKLAWEQMLIDYQLWGMTDLAERMSKVDFLTKLLEHREFYIECLRVLFEVWKNRLFDDEKLVKRERLFKKDTALAFDVAISLKESYRPLSLPPELIAWKARELASAQLAQPLEGNHTGLSDLREATIRILLESYWEFSRKARERYRAEAKGWKPNSF